MICYVYHRLKGERRIEVAKAATLTVNGYSVCDRHSWIPSNSDAMLRGIEGERDALRAWFREAERMHGDFSEKRQKFADGDTLADAEWPWLVTPSTEQPS